MFIVLHLIIIPSENVSQYSWKGHLSVEYQIINPIPTEVTLWVIGDMDREWIPSESFVVKEAAKLQTMRKSLTFVRGQGAPSSKFIREARSDPPSALINRIPTPPNNCF